MQHTYAKQSDKPVQKLTPEELCRKLSSDATKVSDKYSSETLLKLESSYSGTPKLFHRIYSALHPYVHPVICSYIMIA